MVMAVEMGSKARTRQNEVLWGHARDSLIDQFRLARGGVSKLATRGFGESEAIEVLDDLERVRQTLSRHGAPWMGYEVAMAVIESGNFFIPEMVDGIDREHTVERLRQEINRLNDKMETARSEWRVRVKARGGGDLMPLWQWVRDE